jgi:photosystem II stability/assembly factor-like uncharacterized protein
VALISACTTAAGGEAADSSPEAHVETDPPGFNHVHGVAGEAGTDAVLVAAHSGLFRLSEEGDVQIGPGIDLMGFAVATPGRFLASGHPGPGVDLPQPVGLIESTDQGNTWQPLSRQGQSDFHALTVSAAGILGYDGSLLRSADGKAWEELEIPAEPAALSASPDGQQVLATTAQGLLLSIDAGTSWTPVPGAPLLQLVDWAADGRTAVGVDPSGGVWTSQDAAATWEKAAQLDAAPQAVDVGAAADGGTRILVVTATAISESRDGGQTFIDLRRD